MRCPECSFFCADSKDLCPKCYLDLRPHKRHLALPVGNAGASYDELLAQSGVARSAAPKSPIRTAKGGSIFGKLMGTLLPKGLAPIADSNGEAPLRPTPAPHTPQAKVKADPAKPAPQKTTLITPLQPPLRPRAPEPHFPKPAPKLPAQAPAPEVIDLSQLEDELDKAIDKMMEGEPITFEAVPLPESEKASKKVEFDIQFLDEVESAEDARPPDDTPSLPNTPKPEEAGTNEFSAEPLPAEDLQGPGTQIETLLNNLGTIEIELAPAPPPPPPALDLLHSFEAKEGDEVATAFADSAHELSQQMAPEWELGSSQLVTPPKDEQLQILFDLALEELDDPNAAAKYTDEIKTTLNRKVESRSLKDQLQKAEKALEAPTFSLKQGSSVPKIEEQPVDESLPPEPIPASTGRRLTSATIDLFVLLLITLALTISLSFDEPLTFVRAALESGSVDLLELAFPAALFCCFFLWLMIAYPLMWLLVARRTIGALCTGLELVSTDGRQVKASQVLIRTLSFPLSVVTLGTLPVLWGGQVRHDTLSGTLLCRRPSP